MLSFLNLINSGLIDKCQVSFVARVSTEKKRKRKRERVRKKLILKQLINAVCISFLLDKLKNIYLVFIENLHD